MKTDWRRAADDTSKWCLRNLWDARASRFRTATNPTPRDLPYDVMWANGIAFSMLVGGARFDRRFYEPYMSAFFDGMNGYWDKTYNPPGYDAYLSHPGSSDKYYDDNAWMVLTFAEAFALTRDRRYLTRAEEAARFVLSGWDDKGGGVFWKQDRQSRNTCSNAPTAVGLLALARFGDAGGRTEWARRITAWTQKTLQDPADGLYWDNLSTPTATAPEGRVEKSKWTYNSALMIRAHLGLYQRTRDQKQLAEAMRIAAASEKTFVLPETSAFGDDANFSHLLCEAFLLLWRETKAPFLRARVESCGTFALTRLRDPADGGYRASWGKPSNTPEPRKTLMANASVARLFWLLAEV